MIFQQWREILNGKKTQTRRAVKEGERLTIFDAPTVYTPTGRGKWQVGCTYAVQRKRGKPAIWWRPGHHTEWSVVHPINDTDKSTAAEMGYQQLRIRITDIRQERLHDITEEDAIAEGVASVAEYRELWDSINGKTKGARWVDSPLVWVLTFEVVR